MKSKDFEISNLNELNMNKQLIITYGSGINAQYSMKQLKNIFIKNTHYLHKIT